MVVVVGAGGFGMMKGGGGTGNGRNNRGTTPSIDSAT